MILSGEYVNIVTIMGGKALKNTYTRRYSSEEFHTLKDEMESLLSNGLKKFHIFTGWKNKTDFGDMDVLVLSETNSGEDLTAFIKNTFNPSEIFKNGDCISFDYKEFQIDFIKSSVEDWETQKVYLLYGDLGNLVGRLYNFRYNLKYGHKGVSFTVKDDTNNQSYEDWIVSRTPERIFKNIGLSWEKFQKGFDTKEEVFEYVINSPFFNSAIFDFENLNHINRVRNRKRDFYNSFLDYIKDIPKKPIIEFNSVETLKMVQEVWGGLENDSDPTPLVERYENFIYDKRLRQLIKNKVVGIVRGLGYENKQLGEKIKTLTPWMESKLKCLDSESLLTDIKSII